MRILVVVLMSVLLMPITVSTAPADTFAQEQSDAAAAWQLSTQGYPVMGDYHGRYFNHINGLRVTTDQPAVYAQTVYLFGNSVMYGYTVADADTIASALQRLDGADQVVNLGVLGGDTGTAIARLRALVLRPGDTVLWFMGIEESRAIYYAENGTPQSPEWLNGKLDAMRLSMQCDIEAGSAYAKERGVRFIWILQPYLWSMPVTASEASISVPDTLKEADVLARSIQQGLNLPGVERYDFTHVLDAARLSGATLYADHIHLSPQGNALVAHAIYDNLTVY